jgi:site-specific DNA-methyltransferase (adenine-specific)
LSCGFGYWSGFAEGCELIELENAVVFHGSNLDVLPTLPDNSVDAIVTDPPYELGFMGKSWDSSGIAYSVELWQECLRVLKPGGHLLAFGGSRTWHRIAVAIEDAGFDVRDSIAWLYGSGFPKSLDISKAIDKAAGVEREVVTDIVEDLFGTHEVKREREAYGIGNTSDTFSGHADGAMARETLPATDEAKKWQGWGTALKPAFEPVVVARKPLVGTVAANVLQWGVGGLNIDGSRIGYQNDADKATAMPGSTPATEIASGNISILSGIRQPHDPKNGRWPANIILDEHMAGLLDEQSGVSTSLSHNRPQATKWGFGVHQDNSKQYDYETGQTGYGDTGGASRFFYVAKASKKDRNEGLEDLEAQRHSDRENAEGVGGDNPRNRTNEAKQNFHPTVKPTALMEYLVKLVTPPGGTVLDPFTGSGSTGKAALLNGFKFIGIELTADYLPIIEGRLKHAAETYANKATEEETKEQETLF